MSCDGAIGRTSFKPHSMNRSHWETMPDKGWQRRCRQTVHALVAWLTYLGRYAAEECSRGEDWSPPEDWAFTALETVLEFLTTTLTPVMPVAIGSGLSRDTKLLALDAELDACRREFDRIDALDGDTEDVMSEAKADAIRCEANWWHTELDGSIPGADDIRFATALADAVYHMAGPDESKAVASEQLPAK